MTHKELISYCYYDQLTEVEAKDAIKQLYSLDIPLQKINKEYKQLNYLSGRA